MPQVGFLYSFGGGGRCNNIAQKWNAQDNRRTCMYGGSADQSKSSKAGYQLTFFGWKRVLLLCLGLL